MTRALELAERGRGKVRDHPLVGAVVVAAGDVVGEGWYEYDAVDHAETVVLAQAGKRARGATMFVTLEPCAHHGRTPPCADAVAAAGVARVVVGALDPNPKAAGGVERLRAAGVEVDVVDSIDARRQNEAWRTWVALGRPHVTYKAAVTVDGRVTVPGRRWVSGEESRRLVHELRAAVDAVAVGMGTVRADDPRLDARDVGATRQPRRLAFGHGETMHELRSGPLEDVCLTVAERDDGTLSFDVVAETLDRSTLGGLAAGDEVNVEPPLRAGDPLGGHIVQGHVDGVGSLRGSADGLTWFDAPGDVLRYCVEKGSISVDGTSLTVAALDDAGFAVALVPHTLAATTLGTLEPGDNVNLEADVIGKYVERLTMNP